jgi:hypothetical protein
MKSSNMSRSEWVEVGKKMKQILTLYFEVSAKIQEHVPKTRLKYLTHLYAKITMAKYFLDEEVYRQHPGWEDFTKVFYGPDEPDKS